MSDIPPCILVIDVETSVNATKDFPANPYHNANFIVATGYRTTTESTLEPHIQYLNAMTAKPGVSGGVRGLVGHNLTFDLAYLRRFGVGNNWASMDFGNFLSSGIFVWDTSIAEYVLTGQQDKYPSLDDLSKKYGGVLKDSKIKDYWKSGVKTEDIPAAELCEYLKGDVENTLLAYNKQLVLAEEAGQTNLILAMCNAMLGFHEIQFNGLEIDTGKLADMAVTYNLKRVELETFMMGWMERIFRKYSIPNVPNPNSNKDMSIVLFGGKYEYEETVPSIETYKNGKPKTKRVTRTIEVLPSFHPEDFTAETKNPGVYSVTEDVLQRIVSARRVIGGSVPPPGGSPYSFVSAVLEHRKVKKLVSTYIEGISEQVIKNTWDGRVHASYNNVATETGRLSSSNPNMQNIPQGEDAEIKEVFVSRWGDDGVLLEFDYKQLEVVGLAYVSQCASLIKDVVSGIDIHTALGGTLYGPSHAMTKEERRIVKTINFGLIYGGSAGSLADQAGCSKQFATRAIDAFYARYPGVKQWHDRLVPLATQEGKVLGSRTASGLPMHEYEFRSSTGRKYVYRTEDNDYRPGETRWPITKMKNYPVQGFATGDVVPTMVGVIFQVLKNNTKLCDDCLMVNQVHDSIMFDCRKGLQYEAIREIKRVLESAPQIISEIFGITFELPLRVSVSVGKNWRVCKDVEGK